VSAFFERLRAALAPEYELLHELGSGCMGTVYLARDVALDCLVAVKVLRPELWTAESVQQFVDEARILATVRHPDIVPVHKVGEGNGLNFYVMDYLEGDTLRSHLEKHGRLSVHTARKLGRDLLAALGKAHRRGVIHRDVKPANVFLGDEGAVLTDFGIARRLSAAEQTDPQVLRGTAAYMAPEQFAGVADERTDIYAAGMTIYEAFTGRRWEKGVPEAGNWSGVPWNVARVLRRSLALEPQRRWPNAAAFRRALWATRVLPYIRNTIGVAVGCTLLGMAIRPLHFTTLRLRVEGETSSPGLPAGLGDSLACEFARVLDRYPEVSARCVRSWARLWEPDARVRVDVASDGGLIRVRLEGDVPALDTITARGQSQQWAGLAGSVADRAFSAVFLTGRLLDPTLPAAVLPKTLEGRRLFQQAEQLFARARWTEARAAYASAAALDSTCWLCYWRHAEVGRWFDLQDDPTDSVRYLAHVNDFPDYYQRLIRAQRLPEAPRLDSLDALARRWKDFLFGQFRRGDEILHRGPLVGRRRREALDAFEGVLKDQRQFGPALEHVAWLHIAEGDSAEAVATLARVDALGEPSDPAAFAPLALVKLAYAWRFLPEAEAVRRTEELVRAAQTAGFTSLDAGARYLSGFGAPRGQLAFAERLLRARGFERSGGIARVLALVSLGRPDEAIARARELALRFPELAIFADELAATSLAFDRDAARFAREWPATRAALVEAADQRVGSAERRDRAAWMLRVVGERVAAPGLGPGSVALVRAQALAARGAFDSALTATEGLAGIAAQQTDDPFFRTVLHLSRAGWYERVGRPVGARPDLLWHENSDLYGYPTGDPQPAEVDWAFAPLGEWRLASLLDRAAARREDACRAYRDVARLWARGEPLYAARADSASQRLRSLGCEPTP
jgi:tRNA A-37 threonylcarbamoyl transferase component Bud32